jgi:hypothetical protein
MHRTFHRRQRLAHLAKWAGLAALAGLSLAAPTMALGADEGVAVTLVRQDFSDCANANVSAGDPTLDLGVSGVVRREDGTTMVKVAMTVTPDTTYHFFLKCVRLLGDIHTDDEGIGEAVFAFPTNSVGSPFAFDVYPEGAPLGNKFQSVQVAF